MNQAADTVLILTHGADRYVIERVTQAIEERGARAVRFDTDLFPLEARLAARCGYGEDAHGLRCGELALDAARVRAVWARKLWTPRLPESLDPRMREGCARESRAALTGWLTALDGVRWVNPPVATAVAEDKLRQLRLASELGLRVPRTLVTNDPDEVRTLRAEVGPLVTKMLTPLSVSMGRAELFVHTSMLRDQDLADLDGLRFSPMIFQEHIEKRVELRVACVGARCLSGAIDASRSAAGRIDWRRARPDEVRWSAGELPETVAARLRALLARLGLSYGAADLIVTPAGEHVFLELNPGGEWGMLERDLGLPIAAALAEELLEGMTVLIVTHREDNECVEMVSAALGRRGVRAVRFDTDLFPGESALRVRLDGRRRSLELEQDGQTFALDEVTAVWHRRLEFGRRLPQALERQMRAASIEEARRVALGMLASLRCFAVDPWVRIRLAESKQLQLELARAAGLDVPRTLITNDPAAVRVFWEECAGSVVTKMMGSFTIREGGKERVVFTNPLSPDDMAALDGLRLCPMTFQEKLEKAYELRVTVVGRSVFAAAIDSGAMERSRTDWRREGLALIDRWKVHELPAGVERALLAMMDALGLNYGACDLVVTPDGRHVFLEVNPVGEFFWLERENGLPISEALADVLTGRAPRRESPLLSHDPRASATLSP